MKKLTYLSMLMLIPFLLLTLACENNPAGTQEHQSYEKMQSHQQNNISATADHVNSMVPVRLNFDKSIADPDNFIWEGSVTGDVEGSLTTALLDLKETGPIWHVEFDWIIDADDPEESFTARLTGILNNNTGSVVMNGTVVDGWLEGARVHEEGQLVDPEILNFVGTIQVNPATVPHTH